MNKAPARYPHTLCRDQAEAILRALGLREESARAAADGLAWADLMGVDSHGIAMLPIYAQWRAEGRFNLSGVPKLTIERPTGGLVDGDGALGFWPAKLAMEHAIACARKVGVAAVAVRRSNHFGAAGIYAEMAAAAGLIGLAMTNTHAASVAPTGARVAMFGTNPIAFAAPTPEGRPFLFDMATSTVALGKLMAAAYRGDPVPLGWALDTQGRPTTDPKVGYAARLATPLGGTAELSSHKGYGLAAMVEILSAFLPGAIWSEERAPGDSSSNVGHFFLALDPAMFGDAATFAARVAAMMETLRRAPPGDPGQPVLVAGDKEYAAREERLRSGVPLPDALVEALRGVCARHGATFLLDRG
jgi:LDH2 family malate/lactate/ureidoglycolate dehydrogenase